MTKNKDIMNLVTELMNDTAHQEQMHFYVPTINLKLHYNRGNELFRTVDTTTFTNADTGEEIITVPSNIKEISKWSDLELYLKGGKKVVSKHSPVYRVIKAIFDGKVFAAKDPEDEYDVDYDDCILGYEIQTLYF